MSASLRSSIDALEAILVETGLVMHQVSQGAVTSAATVERVCALVAADVKHRTAEIAHQSPSASALRRIQTQRAVLGGFEFALRRAAHEMTRTLAQFRPVETSGTYSPENARLSTAGAWMNVRSAP